MRCMYRSGHVRKSWDCSIARKDDSCRGVGNSGRRSVGRQCIAATRTVVREAAARFPALFPAGARVVAATLKT